MSQDPEHRLSGVIESSSDADLVGKTWSAAMEMEWPPHGLIAFPVPAGWRLFLDAGRKHLVRADAMRVLLPDSLIAARSPNPQPVRMWRDPSALRGFLREAAAGVVLCHTALNNWASDMIPDGFALDIDGHRLERTQLVALGLKRRLTTVAAAWSGRGNLFGDELLGRVLELKSLRDDLEHVSNPTIYTADTSDGAIYARLLRREVLADLADSAAHVIAYYSGV